MMSDVQHMQVRSVLMPCGSVRLLLPNATVAEIINFSAPVAIPDAPSWLIGAIPWRRQAVPLLSVEEICSDRAKTGHDVKVAICYCISGNKSDIRFFGIALRGIPTLMRLSENNIQAMDADDSDCKMIQCRVKVAGIQALIPDLIQLEEMAEAYGQVAGKLISEMKVTEEVPAPRQKAPARKKLVMEDVDEEIVEIFLEEAQENVEIIQEYYPRWKQNPADEEALTTFRRSFHTIKGSGRMVKVEFISEVAWAAENMINRLIDHTIDITHSFYSVLDEVVEMLPSLMDCFIERVHPDFDTQELRERADGVSRGQNVEKKAPIATPLAKKAPAPAPVSSPKPQAKPSGEKRELIVELDNEDVDEELMEIFLEEAQELIDIIEMQFQEWKQQSANSDAAAALHRALHTLKGGARLSGLVITGSTSHALESLLNAIGDQRVIVNEDIINRAQKGVDALAEMIAQIQDGVVPTTDHGIIYELESVIPEDEEAAEAVVPPQAREPVVNFEEIITPIDDIMAHIGEMELDGSFDGDDDLDIDGELLEIFLEESDTLIATMETMIAVLNKNRTDESAVESLQRALHTLKGGARLAGIAALGDLCHQMESMLTVVTDGTIEFTDEVFDLTLQVFDTLASDVDKIKSQEKSVPNAALIKQIDKIIARTRH